MATLREVRNRIVGVKKIQKITRAMKMVSAAKLRRAQMAVIAARPYARHLLELLQHLAAGADNASGSLFTQRPLSRVAIVVVTSDRGMCAAFNSNLVRAIERHIVTHYTLQPGSNNVTLFCIGRKGADYFGRRGYTIAARHIGVYTTLVFAQAKAIAQEILVGYERGDYDRVEIGYNEFKSIAQQRIMIEQYLPVPAVPAEESTGRYAAPIDFLYEPSVAGLLSALVPKHLDFQLWRVLLESNAAEQGARMAAMENATENAEELISTLQLHYNKARQASITRELLEIVGGAEALSKAG